MSVFNVVLTPVTDNGHCMQLFRLPYTPKSFPRHSLTQVHEANRARRKAQRAEARGT